MPEVSKPSGGPDEPGEVIAHYLSGVGMVAGGIAGTKAAAVTGASIGLAFGPLGCLAGMVGGLFVGLVGGRKLGSTVQQLFR